MKRLTRAARYGIVTVLLALLLAPASAAAAEQRFIVRTGGLLDGLPLLQSVCRLLGCNVRSRIDGTLGHLFLVTTSGVLEPVGFLLNLQALPGIVDAEPDLIVRTQADDAQGVPAALLDRELVSFYG